MLEETTKCQSENSQKRYVGQNARRSMLSRMTYISPTWKNLVLIGGDDWESDLVSFANVNVQIA